MSPPGSDVGRSTRSVTRIWCITCATWTATTPSVILATCWLPVALRHFPPIGANGFVWGPTASGAEPLAKTLLGSLYSCPIPCRKVTVGWSIMPPPGFVSFSVTAERTSDGYLLPDRRLPAFDRGGKSGARQGL